MSALISEDTASYDEQYVVNVKQRLAAAIRNTIAQGVAQDSNGVSADTYKEKADDIAETLFEAYE